MYKNDTEKLKLSAVLFSVVLGGCTIAPQEIQTEEILQILEEDEELIAQTQAPIEGALSLSDVMARAVLTNLDQKVSNLEEALALGTFELAKFDMLPSAALSGTYYDRSNENASRSISVITRNQSLEPSTSQEQIRSVADVRLSWNLLDFGVSYYQAKQDADRYLIAASNRKKALIDLLQQARSTYWQALAAQRLRDPVAEIIEQALIAYAEVNQGIEERIYADMVEALQLKKDLFSLIGDLEQLQNDLEQSMVLLKSFINVPSDADVTLVDPGELPDLPELEYDQEALELTALVNSVEVKEEAYNARIEFAETRKALLRLLPGLELGLSDNYNNNKYLYNNEWNEASVRISWNLLRLASTGSALKSTRLRNELQLQRRLAANMAVITRLNVAQRQYSNQLRELNQALEIQKIDEQIAQLTQNAVASTSEGQVNYVRSEVEALTAELTYLQSYAQSQEAFGTVMVSLGFNPLPFDYNAQSIDDLSDMLAQSNANWLSGNLPFDNEMLRGEGLSEGGRQQGARGAGEPAGNGEGAVPAAAMDEGQGEEALEVEEPSSTPGDEPPSVPTLDEISNVMDQWLSSWREQKPGEYFSFYDTDFLPSYHPSRGVWRAERMERVIAPEWIMIDYDELEVVEEGEDFITVRFWLHYNSPEYEDETWKEVRFDHSDKGWLIVTERNLAMMIIDA